jgi:hypothetical protein
MEVVVGLILMGVVCGDLFDLHPYGKGVVISEVRAFTGQGSFFLH